MRPVFVAAIAEIFGVAGMGSPHASGKARAHFKFPIAEGPPPPGSIDQMEAFGRGILLGRFSSEGTWDRAIDPTTQHVEWLMKPYVRVPHDLGAHFDWSGNAMLYDFDDHLRVDDRTAVHIPARRVHHGLRLACTTLA